jgi:YesN/AraC family two-component response regulator
VFALQQDILLENKQFLELNPLIFGYEQCKPQHSFGPNIRSYYLIHFVVSGCGILYKDDKEYKITKNQAFLIEPNKITTYTSDTENPWHYIWIGFNGNLSKTFDSLKSPVLDVNVNLFLEMTFCENMQSLKEEFLTGKFFLLYASLFAKEYKSDYTQQVKSYINSNFMNKIFVHEIADRLNLDRHYLSRIFNQ